MNFRKSIFLKNTSRFVFTMLVSFLVLYIGAIIFSTYAIISRDRTPRTDPSEKQKEMIEQSINIICTIDDVICHTSNNKQIHYKVQNLPPVLNIGRAFYFSHYAITNESVNGFQISLTSHLFDDIGALTIFLFHELKHIESSDFKLYQENDLTKRCIDHNLVKEATTDFALKLDDWTQSPSGSLILFRVPPSRYTKLPGNTVQKCNL